MASDGTICGSFWMLSVAAGTYAAEVQGSLSLGPYYNPKLMLFSPRWRDTWGVLYSVPRRSEPGLPTGDQLLPLPSPLPYRCFPGPSPK